MTDILIKMKNGSAVLTTDSPVSSRGIPILRVNAETVQGDFGPADIIGDDCTTTAAEIVRGWAKEGKRTKEEIEAAKLFLSQWPEGPQIE
jgi:hypothetical protein